MRKALEASPENGAYIDSLGWVYYKKGMFEEARIELERASEIIGDDPVIHDHLGDVYFKIGDLDKARESWEKSLELEANDEVKKKIERLQSENSKLRAAGNTAE